MFRVRPPTSADLDEIVALENRAFPIPWKPGFFESEIGERNRFSRIARDTGGGLAGYVFCDYTADEVHVNKIAVDELWRRRGVARLLMWEVFGLVTRLAAKEIFLEVRPSNHAARSFYGSLGFTDLSLRKGYYVDGEDALVMRWRTPGRGEGNA